MISQSLLPEFDQEMASTRKTIERAPESLYDYKPHEKAFSLKDLMSHIVHMAGWTEVTLKQDSFDMSPEGGEPTQQPAFETTAAALEAFDKGVAAARTALEATSDEAFAQPWSLLNGGQAIFTMPRLAVLRSMIFNHLIHHRGQLTVYYRIKGVPVPALYGPSGDEQN